METRYLRIFLGLTCVIGMAALVNEWSDLALPFTFTLPLLLAVCAYRAFHLADYSLPLQYGGLRVVGWTMSLAFIGFSSWFITGFPSLLLTAVWLIGIMVVVGEVGRLAYLINQQGRAVERIVRRLDGWICYYHGRPAFRDRNGDTTTYGHGDILTDAAGHVWQVTNKDKWRCLDYIKEEREQKTG